jgi:endo-1,4-beta-xylanase
MLQKSAAWGVAAFSNNSGRTASSQMLDERPLKSLANRSARLVGVFSGQHELMKDPVAAQIIADEFDLLAIGNDLKMKRLRPMPDSYDFSYGDYDLAWAEKHGLLLRGHTLVWHMALPSWFRSYVNEENAQLVMTDHITTVMKHYAGKMYSWDVVNEPVRNIDNRLDGLRVWPWLEAIGPEYIEIAFHTAAAADPKAKLFLNENNFEHELPLHAQRRDTLLGLLTSLKNKKVPITGLGTQGHIRADTPFATQAVRDFFKACQDLGLEIMITELDVDDSNIPGPEVDTAVARKYAEYLDLVGPFASAITFEAVADDPNLPKRSDGLSHRPNLFDPAYEKKPSYKSAATSIGKLTKVEGLKTKTRTYKDGP